MSDSKGGRHSENYQAGIALCAASRPGARKAA
jgi:hypothetical protein